MRNVVSALKRAAFLFASASAALFALAIVLLIPAHASESGPYVEAFGAYVWPGNISSGGEDNPDLRITLERSGEYAFGGGAGYVFGNGVNLGAKVRYTRNGCDENAGEGECADLVEGYELEMATLGILGTIGYTLETPLIIDPFVEFDAGLGYVALDCENRDSCPLKKDENGYRYNANAGDVGFLWGFCGGLKGPLTDDRRLEFLVDACWHRIESASATGVPHWDAPDAITAGLRIRYRL